jgi:hypothetical protein
MKTATRKNARRTPSVSRIKKPEVESSGRREPLGEKELDKQIRLKKKQFDLKLLEHSLTLLADPHGVYADKVDSEVGWTTIGLESTKKKRPTPIYTSQEELDRLVGRARNQEYRNPFARNLYENRINYIVGLGSEYKVKARNKSGKSRLSVACGKFLRELLFHNNFDELEQEIVHRTDRDGECFVRMFRLTSGMTEYRFVEPHQVRTPKDMVDNPQVAYGIKFDPEDSTKPLVYYVHYSTDEVKPIPVEEMFHFKGNVDSDEVRGISLAYSAYEALEYAVKLLRNMAVVTTVQASIAMVRKHGSTKPESVKNFRSGRDSDPTGLMGQFFTPAALLENAGVPRIWDTTQGFDYEFPAVGIDVAKMVEALQASLRAAAASVQMPEFMISSNAANANYSSSMVSEGPAVRSFGRAQNFFGEKFVLMLMKGLMWAIRSGRVAGASELTTTVEGMNSLIEITIKHPEIKTKKNKEETDRRKVLRDSGVLSLQEWSREEDLDYEVMQREIKQHLEFLKPLLPPGAEISITPAGAITITMPQPVSPGGPGGVGAAKKAAVKKKPGKASTKPRPSRDV